MTMHDDDMGEEPLFAVGPIGAEGLSSEEIWAEAARVRELERRARSAPQARVLIAAGDPLPRTIMLVETGTDRMRVFEVGSLVDADGVDGRVDADGCLVFHVRDANVPMESRGQAPKGEPPVECDDSRGIDAEREALRRLEGRAP